jgi:hypothetical protein
MFLEIGIKTSVETITFLSIRVSMITSVLKKVVECLSVLKYSVGTIGVLLACPPRDTPELVNL